MTSVLVGIVWLGILLPLYHLVGYPLLLIVLAPLFGRPVHKDRILPSVSLLISAYNEESVIKQKLDNSLSLSYPNLQVIVNTEGSTDDTFAMACEYSNQGVMVLGGAKRRGKVAAVNRAVAMATHEIIVLSDANVFYDTNAISSLVRNFADPGVGAVTGCKTIRPSRGNATQLTAAEAVYWRWENWLKKLETRFWSTVGVHGEMLALKKELFAPIPDGVINDDAYLAMHCAKQGARVVYDEDARCWEAPSPTLADDDTRRSRITAGRVQLIKRLIVEGWLPWKESLCFLSHKVLRVAMPVLLLLGFVANVLVVGGGESSTNMRIIFAGQISFLALAIFGAFGGNAGRMFLPARVAAYVASGLASGLVGLLRAFRGKQDVLWVKAQR